MDWTLEARRTTGLTHVVPAGELDLVTAPLLSRALREAEQQTDAILLDLTRVSFMDSSGLAAVLEAVQRSREHDRVLRIRPGEGAVIRVLALANVLEDLPLEQG
ncbi:MAG: anti-sigma factor antagonist [Solirubrobacterales bacterium]|jgi:anti-sigma B factor antagonist|nr:anti-sigma factor antagonist [Solirubrobacterales bacterium]